MKKLSIRKLSAINTLFKFILFLTLIFSLTACGASNDNNGIDGDSSKTNTQEPDIDEADIVKVNGAGYIFKAQTDGVTVSRIDKNGKLNLLKSSKASEEFTPKEMFIYEENYIIVIGASSDSRYYDSGYYNDTMVIRIYDLTASTGEELILKREDEFRGTYKTSRLYIGGEKNGELYLITSYRSSDSDSNYYIDFYNGKINFDVTDGNGDGFLIAKLNMKKPESKYKTGLYAGKVYDIYFSRFAIYTMRQINIGRGCNYIKSTEIDKISLDNLQKKASVKNLDGFSPNRFCLYDDGSYLYVVNQKERDTETKETIKSGTYVYTYSNDKLKQVASIGAIATGEQLKSARFDGDICYVVTFRVVDPLFKVDLSDPLNPRLTGELKIDGFSTYMQAFGEGLLIGIGYGNNQANLKITAFEISSDYPDELNSIELLDGSAEARENPRAILCDPEKNIFAFSASAKREQSNGTWAKMQGAYIFGLKDGELQEIAFLSDLPEDYKEDSLNSRREITRIHWIGDNLITISDGFIISYNLNEVMAGNHSIIDKLDTRIVDYSLTVKFDTADENIIVPPQIIEQGKSAIEPPSIVKEGYRVQYWYKDNENIKYNFANAVWESFTLHAKWEAVTTYKISFDTGVSDIEAPLDQLIVNQDTVQIPENPARDGYYFLYWYTDNPDEEYDFSTLVDKSFTLYAKWEKLEDFNA